MAEGLSRGDVWSCEFKSPDKRRPVVVLSREGAIAVLDTVLVAPVTSKVRGLPTEVRVGVDEGLKNESAVNLDHVQTVRKDRLRRYLGRLGADRMRSVCRALSIATGCDT